ncbi:MAG: PIN domain-containing protein [Tepidisphaeraceae bacterium]
MRVLLDTSAVLAYFFGEPGAERVREVLSDERTPVGMSVLTAAEFWGRLHAEGAEGHFDDDWRKLTEIASDVIPVSLAVVFRAIELRRAATARLPYVDALIAATAAEYGAVLMHRDPHFAAIPVLLLPQELLRGK